MGENKDNKEEELAMKLPLDTSHYINENMGKVLPHNNRPDNHWKTVYISQKSRCNWAKKAFGECMGLNNNRIEWCRIFRDYMEGYCAEDEVLSYFVSYMTSLFDSKAF